MAHPETLWETGDQIGDLTYIGLSRAGHVICRCRCGRIDAYPVEQISSLSRKKKKKNLWRLCCADCLSLRVALQNAPKTAFK